MGIVSKTLLEEINNKLNNHLCYNQWLSTFTLITLIEWFRAIEKKENCKLIKLDIAEFYPSLSAELLEKSINFARSTIEIKDKIIKIIKHARKYLLFHDDNAWVKNEGNPSFVVTMGIYDGAEVCELVGLYLLTKLAHLIDKKTSGFIEMTA